MNHLPNGLIMSGVDIHEPNPSQKRDSDKTAFFNALDWFTSLSAAIASVATGIVT